MLRARERKQITSVAPKFEQILLTSPGGWKNDRSFRSEALKKSRRAASRRRSAGRSTIFFHRDGISWNKPDFNVDRNSDRNGRYPVPPPLPPPQLPLRRNVTPGSLGHGTRTSRRKLVPHDGTVTTGIDSRTVVIPRYMLGLRTGCPGIIRPLLSDKTTQRVKIEIFPFVNLSLFMLAINKFPS